MTNEGCGKWGCRECYPGEEEETIMNTYRLTGNYGTFVIQRIIEAEDGEDAWCQTGIATTLIAAGWTMLEMPEGEEWDVEIFVNGAWEPVEEY